VICEPFWAAAALGERVRVQSRAWNQQASSGRKSAALVSSLLAVVGAALGASACNRAQPPSPPPQVASQNAVKPIAATPPAAPNAVEKQGEALYGRICAVCHGAAGEGYKADQAPALNRADYLSSVSDMFLRRAIRDGRKGSTMSAWAIENGGPLSPADVDAVVAFIRSWHRTMRTDFDEQVSRGNVEHGAATYARECASCHGAEGKGGKYVQIGNPQLLIGVTNGFLRAVIREGRPGTPMPAFATKLDAQAVEDVVAYLRDLLTKAASQAEPIKPRTTPPPLPLGKVPLNPRGPEAVGFKVYPETTPGDVVHQQLERHARIAILDARASSDYLNEHIAGSVSVPFYDPSPYYDALPKNAWLVCYCSCPSAESGALAKKLQEHGFKKVTVLAEGFGFWKSKKYGTHSGDKP
jgi:cytochrome c oxidase cbb3-type subunit 3